MSRPKPQVLIEITDKKTFKSEQVLEAEAIWAVFYKGSPINLKTSSFIVQDVSPKYKKVSFSNSGHAHNLAEKLNKRFNSTDFAVFKLVTGDQVVNDPKS